MTASSARCPTSVRVDKDDMAHGEADGVGGGLGLRWLSVSTGAAAVPKRGMEAAGIGLGMYEAGWLG